MIPPPLLAKLASPLVRYAAIGLVSAFAAGWVVWQIKDATINRMKAEYAEARTKAVQEARDEEKRIAGVTLEAALADATNQVKIVKETEVITKWAIKNVEVVANCPSLNLIRLHNNAAIGSDPEGGSGGPGELNAEASPTLAPVR